MEEEKQNIRINIDTNANQAAQDTNKLAVALDNVDNSAAQTEETYKSLKTQLREANQELVQAIQLYGETSEQAIKAARGVADLKDQIGFAKDLSDSFNPDQKMKALGAATQIAATGMQGVTAGMALFGDQSEQTEKMLLKVQAAMAFSDAISGLSNLGDQWKTLKAVVASATVVQKANAATTMLAAGTTRLFSGSVNVTSNSFKILKGAIAATGIGLLVVGVAALINNFDKIKEVAYKLVPQLRLIGKAISTIVNAVTDFVGATSAASRALNKQKEFAEKALAQNEKYLKRHENTLSDSQKRELELRNAHFQRVKEGEFSHAESLRIYREAKAKDARLAQEKADKEALDAQQKANQKAKDAREKADAEKKKAEEDRKKAAYELKVSQEKEDKDRDDNLRKVGEENAKKRDEENQEKTDQDAKNQIANWEYLASEKKKIDDARIEQEKFVEDKKKEIADNGINFLKTIAGKNKAIQKAAIVAEGIVSVARSIKNIAEGNAAALARSILQLGPIAGPPAATPAIALNTAAGSLSVATTVAQTAKALQAIGGGGGTISGGSSGGINTGSGGSAPPSVAFQNSSENQISRSVVQAQTEQPPLQVTVLESDITKAQNNVTVLQNKNKF